MYTESIGCYTLEQPDGVARPGADSLALAAFVTLKPRDRVCDLGCGGGAIALLMLSRSPDIDVTAVDKYELCIDTVRANAARNGLESKLRAVQSDWGGLPAPAPLFDVTVSNPPYFSRGHGTTPPDGKRANARVWDAGGLDALCHAAARITRHGGRLAVVYPAGELVNLFAAMRARGWEPKRLRFAHHGADKDASFVTVEARLGGKPGLTAERILDLL